MDIWNKLQAESAARLSLDEYQAKRLLSSYGIPVVEEFWIEDLPGAMKAVDRIGFPVVLKAIVAGMHHKTEHGLVKLNIRDKSQLAADYSELQSRLETTAGGFVVQRQIAADRELMAGMTRDRHFGPVVMLGLGGILTEALKDISLALSPVSGLDFETMVSGLQCRKLLGPWRGQNAVNLKQLRKIITALAQMATDHPELDEIDINPLVIDARGRLTAVDALMTFKGKTRAESVSGRTVTPSIIHQFFHPQSVVFIGASAKMGKWGHMLTVNTIGGGYNGRIFLVNPKGGKIAGRKVYRSVTEIEAPIDLAVVTVPAINVLSLLDQLRVKHIDKVLMITSGFGESGSEGKTLENKVVETAARAGIHILGPNTMGICNPHINFFCTGTAVRPLAGTTAVVAQSGNMGTQLLAFAEQQGIGIRAFAGSGNEAMITMEDYLEAFGQDPETRTIMVYLENIANGRRFFEIAKNLSLQKPIVLLKGGQSHAGNRAAASHTGAMATDTRIFDAMCRQAGIIKVEHPMDLLDLAASFSSLPLPRGNKVAIMTLGGGWGVVTADLCSKYNLKVPALSRNIIEKIDRILPPYWSRSNPVDLVGEPDTHIPMQILEILLQWKGCDAVIDLGIMGRVLFIKRLAESMRKADPTVSESMLNDVLDMFADFEKNYTAFAARLMQTTGKPVFGATLLSESGRQTVNKVAGTSYKAVYYETPERAVKAMAQMFRYYNYVSRAN